MKDMFAQGGSGSVGIKTNKQAIARACNVKVSEVIYSNDTTSTLDGKKIIYDKVSQRAYPLPNGLPTGTTIISLSTSAVLLHSSGSTDLGELALSREEYFTKHESFSSGFTINTKNEQIVTPEGYFVWGGALPKEVPPGSTISNTGGISDTAWVLTNEEKFISKPDGFGIIGSIDSISSLRELSGKPLQRVQVSSYHSGISGGGGFFYWDSTSTRADDNGVVIKPTSVSGPGRWIRECSVLYIEDFGAYTTATDNTQAIADAIKAAGNGVKGDVYTDAMKQGIRKVSSRGGRFNVIGISPIIVPAMVDIDLNGAELVGNGTNTMFVTGGFNPSTGVLESNVALADNTYRVTGTKVRNFIVRNAGLGFNFRNFAEESELHSVTFVDCAQDLIAKSSWYGAFHTMTSRNPTAPKTHTQPAFLFDTYINSQNIHNINVTQRKLAYRFDGAVNGQRLEFVNAESCDRGLVFTGEVMPIEIYGYYEDITDLAIDMGAAQAHRAIKIGGFFNNVNTCFYGNQLSSGVFGENTYFLNCTTKFNTDAGSLNGLTVNIPPAAVSVNTLPSVPSGWTFSGFEKVVFPTVALDGSGNFIARQNFTGGKVDLPFSGDQGDASTTIPFCSQFNEGVATRSIYTAITFRPHMVVLINLTVEGQKVRGRVYDDAVYLDGTVANLTITPSNNGGYLKLTFTGGLLPATPNNIVGIVRLP